jgi:hypothetical protein
MEPTWKGLKSGEAARDIESQFSGLKCAIFNFEGK